MKDVCWLRSREKQGGLDSEKKEIGISLGAEIASRHHEASRGGRSQNLGNQVSISILAAMSSLMPRTGLLQTWSSSLSSSSTSVTACSSKSSSSPSS